MVKSMALAPQNQTQTQICSRHHIQPKEVEDAPANLHINWDRHLLLRHTVIEKYVIPYAKSVQPPTAVGEIFNSQSIRKFFCLVLNHRDTDRNFLRLNSFKPFQNSFVYVDILFVSHPFETTKFETAEARRKPSGISRGCEATNEPGLRRVPSGCPRQPSSQYFVDAIRDEDTQNATRLMDTKDLKSALAYSMKYEAAKTAFLPFRNIRPIEVEDGTVKVKDEKFYCLLKALEKILNSRVEGKKNTPRRI
ncbi:hypothetical protein AVEN_156618-1 [Araneus ventricosus]|uniref:Uncharacterized protein n=1 Tax=Araneus ventricosus TaxID=182803 RepID=A0A4Y2NW05_ARAVE|nr:hypothetical protein AVEN_156618-1 [Araneus ventricosus]